MDLNAIRRSNMDGVVSVLVVGLLFTTRLWAQGAAADQTAGAAKAESPSRVYEINTAVELGARIAGTNGSRPLWKSYVNLDSGPRLLEYTLDLHAPKHNGRWFDDLSFGTLGIGGDPNATARLRVVKGKWYRLDGDLRYDNTFFDYDLLANPLNPPTSVPNVPILQSPHQSSLTRRAADFTLQLFPVSRLRVRLAYGHGSQDGTSMTSAHLGTDVLLVQPWKTSQDTYRAGISWRPVQRFDLSFDQSLMRFRNDGTAALATTGPFMFTLPNGQPVNLGVAFNTSVGQPCAAPIVSGGANPLCNGVVAFSQFTPIRSLIPNEQFGFQGTWKRLDTAGRVNYSAGHLDRPDYRETFSGENTRTQEARYTVTGAANNRRLAASADYGLTLHLRDNVRIVDRVRWSTFRIPGGWDMASSSLFSTSLTASPVVLSPAACPPPSFTAADCPPHTAASGPDVMNQVFRTFLSQDSRSNTTELEYDFAQKTGVRVGYRFAARRITFREDDVEVQQYFPIAAQRGACVDRPVDSITGICTVTTSNSEDDRVSINGHSGLFGVWVRPNNRWRANVDGEIVRADNAFTRISPRAMELFRVRTTYKPRDWATVVFVANLQHSSNDQTDVNHDQHNRVFALDASVAPRPRWSVDGTYSYTDVFSRTDICFVSAPTPVASAGCSSIPFLSGLSVYEVTVRYAALDVQFTPTARAHVTVGYAGTTSRGRTLVLNPADPAGPLAFTYRLPTVGVAVDVTSRWTWRAGVNVYRYVESAPAGPTAARNFRGQVAAVSLRYSK